MTHTKDDERIAKACSTIGIPTKTRAELRQSTATQLAKAAWLREQYRTGAMK